MTPAALRSIQIWVLHFNGGNCLAVLQGNTPYDLAVQFFGITKQFAQDTAASVTVTVTAPLSGIPAAERQILLNIYNSTNGASWSRRTNWLAPVGTECTWLGVGCNASLNHVEVLSLSSNNLTGTLPSINGLVALRQIDFSGNQLTGQIPSLSGLSVLWGIWVGYNQLTGALPSFSGLAALQAISAPYNQLTGSIPSLSDQAVLQSFNVNNNRLTGPVPAAPSSLSTGGNDLCGNNLVSSGNPAIDIAWQNATARNWLACQTASAAPVCHVAATPTTIHKNGTSILTPTCTPAATTYLWTGGTCQGTTAPSS